MHNLTALLIWIFLAVLLLAYGLRRAWVQRHRGRRPIVDDDAIERILAQGILVTDDDEPLDEEEIARAEAEFWEESWDEPDEYSR